MSLADPIDEPKRRGRPRSDRARDAILAVAYDLVAERGFAGVTTAEIAAAAGSGKQTIYRWWPTKQALVFDALTAREDDALATMKARSLPACLNVLCKRVAADAPVLRVLIAEAQHDWDLRENLRQRWVAPRRDFLKACLLATGHVEGRILDRLVAMIEGAIWTKLLLNEPLDDDFVDELVIVAELLAGN
jgi:AcrR family transcriptional regulator